MKLNSEKASSVFDALHIFSLFSLAVAQPLYEQLSRHPEVLVSWHLKPLDIFLLICLLSILLPLLLFAVKAISRIFGRLTQKATYAMIIFGLLFLLLLQICKKLFELPDVYLIVIAAVASAVFTTLYFIFKETRLFVTLLSPAIILFPLLFLFNPSIQKIVFKTNASGTAYSPIEATHPVVMVVFDEFPASSIMDMNRLVDGNLYPNFARLARDAYWYRNASTVAERTFAAVPAILTGLYPNANRIPIASDFPGSLFTLLGGSYDMKVFEPDTMICPASLCQDFDAEEEVLNQMYFDLPLIYLHIVTPQRLAGKLPPVNLTQKGYVNLETSKDYHKSEMIHKINQRITASQSLDRAALFERFTDCIKKTPKPTLYFIHVMIPHLPWEYFPSGKVYSKSAWKLPGLDLQKDLWNDDEWLIRQGYQRHLLQVGYADTLLGKLMDKLKATGLYDDALIVVTADHGLSFFPNRERRKVYPQGNMDILAVPLFIKKPHHTQGVLSDRNVETIDILPTIADILDIPVTWNLDGHSMMDSSFPERHQKRIYDDHYNLFIFDSPAASYAAALERKFSFFGTPSKMEDILTTGHLNELIGKQASALTGGEMKGVTCVVDQETSLADVNPESNYIPALITGRLLIQDDTIKPSLLGLAINGEMAAVTKSYRDVDHTLKFSFLVPESAFKPGRHIVGVYSLADNPAERKIFRIPKWNAVTYTLEPEGIIRSSAGEKFQIVKNTFSGSLDDAGAQNNYFIMRGWAAHPGTSNLPEVIVVFVNGEFLHAGPCNQDRPDVVKHFNNHMLMGSGFHYTFSVKKLNGIDRKAIRLFALSDDGHASEIN